MYLRKGSGKGSVPANIHRETNTQTLKKTKGAIKLGVFLMIDIQKRVFPDYVMSDFIIRYSIVALLENIATLFLF